MRTASIHLLGCGYGWNRQFTDWTDEPVRIGVWTLPYTCSGRPGRSRPWCRRSRSIFGKGSAGASRAGVETTGTDPFSDAAGGGPPSALLEGLDWRRSTRCTGAAGRIMPEISAFRIAAQDEPRARCLAARCPRAARSWRSMGYSHCVRFRPPFTEREQHCALTRAMVARLTP